MTQNDYDDFSQMICATGELYKQKVGEFAIQLWFSALEEYELVQISQALSLHVKNPDNGQFMPKPADVVKFIHGTSQDNAFGAWAKTERALRSVGAYSSVCFDDPLIHATVMQLGGWVKLCQTLEKDLPFVANDFEKIYRGYISRKTCPEYPPYLVGISEAENSQKGLKSDNFISIGNPDRAELVFKKGSSNPSLTLNHVSLPEQGLKRIGSAA